MPVAVYLTPKWVLSGRPVLQRVMERWWLPWSPAAITAAPLLAVKLCSEPASGVSLLLSKIPTPGLLVEGSANCVMPAWR